MKLFNCGIDSEHIGMECRASRKSKFLSSQVREGFMRTLCKARQAKYMSELPKVTVVAEGVVAYKSPDHIVPHGTMRDNSRNRWFNTKLYDLFPVPFGSPCLKVLDLGCSGGGFIKDVLDDGHLGVGLEGSDYSKKTHRAEWASIPDNLFTCDITARFDVYSQRDMCKERILFDVVTAWEVMEHIAKKDLTKVAANVKRHMAATGLLIMSIANYDYFVNGVNLHQTVEPKEWWIKTFHELGWTHLEPMLGYFDNFYVRGEATETEQTFHLILSMQPDCAPKIPNVAWTRRVLYRWVRSRLRSILINRLGFFGT
jgi:2-polyprenyl-3-methyl-5-hydroxy-6-metoxy-1,4-benzoquinol methylase